MKKFILLFVIGLLVSAAFPVAAQSPLTNFSLLGGNIYFTNPGNGDGTARWVETRVLFGRGNDYRLLSGGFFVNYNEVGSKLDGFLYHDQEVAFGPALNFGSQYWSESNEIWGWLNAGLKIAWDRGQIESYDTEQKDKLLYLFGGIMFKNSLGRGPFFIKKFMVTYQQPLKSERDASWEGNPTFDSPANKGYVKLVAENTFVSLPLTASESLRFEPKITASAAYEFNGSNMIYSTGIGLTLAREYSQEILTLEGGVKFQQQTRPIYSVGALINVVELGKAIFSK